MTQRNPNLFADAVKYVNECVIHMEDDDLTPDDERNIDMLIHYCNLLSKRRKNPKYGRDNKRSTGGK